MPSLAANDYTVNEASSFKVTEKDQVTEGSEIKKTKIKEKDYCALLKGAACGKKESVAGFFRCPVGDDSENLKLIPVCVG